MENKIILSRKEILGTNLQAAHLGKKTVDSAWSFEYSKWDSQMQRKTISKFSDQWMGDPIRVAQGWNAHRNSFPKEDPKKT